MISHRSTDNVPLNSTFSETVFEPKTFVENDDLDLSCSISEGSYSTVTLLKVTQGDDAEATEAVMAVYRSDGTSQVLTDKPHSLSVVARQADTLMRLTLTLRDAGCGDNGTYACRHDNGQTSVGEVSITSEFVYGVYLIKRNMIEMVWF